MKKLKPLAAKLDKMYLNYYKGDVRVPDTYKQVVRMLQVAAWEGKCKADVSFALTCLNEKEEKQLLKLLKAGGISLDFEGIASWGRPE